jgi:hypothetical protein
METYGGMEVYLYAFLISELDEGEWIAPHTDRFTSEEKASGKNLTGGWVGPTVGLNVVGEKTYPSFDGNRNPTP